MDEGQCNAIQQTLKPFRLSKEQLLEVMRKMRKEMDLGLRKDSPPDVSVHMLPTYVCCLPDGTEKGTFLALDLGGSNFRVFLVKLGDETENGYQQESQTYSLNQEVMQGTGEQLFDYIADCLVRFLLKKKVRDHLPLGFTFSFPCHLTSLHQGILLKWTKGFNALDCVGRDVVQLLQAAIQRRKELSVEVVAIVNDAVGTMMSCAYNNPRCEVGLIVGTGSNVCYMEQMKNIEMLEGNDGQMCIDMEWEAFGEGVRQPLGGVVTEFDKQVDEDSMHPGKQIYEKMISGMYLGEIVRYVLLHLTERGLLFKGTASCLRVCDVFKTKFLSQIESDAEAPQAAASVLQELGLAAGRQEYGIVKEVCQVVSQRAAQLCGAGLAAVLEKLREDRGLNQLNITVGVDGTLYKLHPHYSRIIHQTVKDLAPKCEVDYVVSEDGSGRGAALVAAVSCHHRETR